MVVVGEWSEEQEGGGAGGSAGDAGSSAMRRPADAAQTPTCAGLVLGLIRMLEERQSPIGLQ